jgi:hypothetical protein
MRKIILVLCVLLVLVCAACADADVHYGLSETNVVTREYSVQLSSIELEARTYADSIKDFWSSKGMDADVELLDNSLLIIGDSATLSETRQSAVKGFSDLLTADDSLLRDVIFEYTPSFEHDDFSLHASITIDDVIRQNEIRDIPEQDLDELLISAQNGTYTFSVSLPGKVVSTNADVTLGQKYTWNLEYGSTTLIDLQTQIVNTENILYYEKLQQAQRQSDMFVKIAIASAVALALALILFFVIRRAKMR